MKTASGKALFFVFMLGLLLGPRSWGEPGEARHLPSPAGTGAEQVSSAPAAPSAGSPTETKQGVKAHRDHNPRHGGTFFMCLDNKHHLEGTLLPPGMFRLYLYDAYTRPLAPDKVKEANGTVRVGDAAGAAEIPLTLSTDGRTLEAALGKEAKLPLTLILLLHLPGSAAGAKPERYAFPFSHYTEPSSAGQP